MSTNGVIPLAELRARAKAALAPASPADPLVLDLVDSVEPPVLMLDWDDPWLEYRTACLYWARLSILCIAGRLEPLPGVETIEQLAVYALERMRMDGNGWNLTASQANRILRVGNVPYFGARLTYQVPTSI